MQNGVPDIPQELREPEPTRILTASEWWNWIQSTFIEEGSLHNPDHSHLQYARIGVLLTNEKYVRKGRRVCGEAREAKPKGSNAWKKCRAKQQLVRWFGPPLPDFVITLDSLWIRDRVSAGAYDAVCALVEHELYHCAQDTGANGMPAFDSNTGRPRWTIAPHDIEEFIGVAERYGAARDDIQKVAQAIHSGPTVTETDVNAACGVCV